MTRVTRVPRASRATQVLVVGAGPTGLALALQATAHGAHVRIVERRREAFRPSRALIMHPRTLEVLRPLGVTDQLLARADIAPEAELHVGSRVVHIRLAEPALADTAFPHLSLVRQMDVETVLADALVDRGVEVERDTELIEVCDGVASAQVGNPAHAGWAGTHRVRLHRWLRRSREHGTPGCWHRMAWWPVQTAGRACGSRAGHQPRPWRGPRGRWASRATLSIRMRRAGHLEAAGNPTGGSRF